MVPLCAFCRFPSGTIYAKLLARANIPVTLRTISVILAARFSIVSEKELRPKLRRSLLHNIANYFLCAPLIRYNNITVSYKAYIIDNYNENIKGLRNALMSRKGYQRLQDTVNPEEYRLAKAIPFEIDEHGVLRAAEFTMQFICKPQRFLVAGDIPIEVTGSATILNQYEESAKPLIRAYGTGSFSIGGVSVQITSANGYTDIDCELQEAFKDTLATNRNSYIVLPQGKFPILAPGDNAVTISGLTKLEITPRWWIL